MKNALYMGRRFVAQIIFCWAVITFLFINPAAAQLRAKDTKPRLVKCSMSIDSAKITAKQTAITVVTIENLSDGELNLSAYYSLELLTNSARAISRDFSVIGDSYWSPLDISTGESLKLPVNGRVPKGELHLKKGELKSIRFDLARLMWNATMSSIWPHENLLDVVPKGNYWLVLKVISNVETTSNRIDLTVE